MNILLPVLSLLILMVILTSGRNIHPDREHETVVFTEAVIERIALKVQLFNSLVHQQDKINNGIEEVLYTEEQIDYLLSNIDKRRLKRDIRDRPSTKWISLPIHWRFSGEHSLSEQEKVVEAFDTWQNRTCVSFKQLQKHEQFAGHSLLITKSHDRCSTYIGRMSLWPQPMNLGDRCFKEKGVILHEIGHALGFWHDQQREDRDEYITLNRENLMYSKGQFFKRGTLMNLPYDYNSIMHYNAKDGGFGKVVMETIDPLFQKNIGQRVDLSYLNVKAIDIRYGGDICEIKLQCKNGGYTNPDKCHECKCPDIFTGTFCELVEPSNGVCGGQITVTDDVQTLSSPGYHVTGYYDNRLHCTWLLSAQNHTGRVVVEFVDEFGVYSHKQDQCYHWLEIFAQGRFDVPGYRICGYKRPTRRIVSRTNSIGLVFKSAYDTIWKNSRRGFKIRYYLEKPDVDTVSTSTKTNSVSVTPGVDSRDERCSHLNIAFLLDSSGSVGQRNWQLGLQFVRTFTENEHTLNTAVISFGNEATTLFDLSDLTERRDLIDVLMTSTWKDQYTNTRDALIVARNQIFKKTGNTWPNRVILVTDGEANVKQQDIFLPAILLRMYGVRVHVLAIGRHANQRQAAAISGSRDRVMSLWTYEQLNQKINEIKDMACH